MLDNTMRRLIDRPLNRAAGHLARAGIAANGVTVAGFAVGGGALAALAAGQYLLALVLILINRLADGLDGALARRQGVTDLGGYLDIVFDFIFYSGMVFGFALGRPDMAIPAAFLMFSFVGTGTAFLAYAVIAAKRGLTTEVSGPKSLYYVGGAYRRHGNHRRADRHMPVSGRVRLDRLWLRRSVLDHHGRADRCRPPHFSLGQSPTIRLMYFIRVIF